MTSSASSFLPSREVQNSNPYPDWRDSQAEVFIRHDLSHNHAQSAQSAAQASTQSQHSNPLDSKASFNPDTSLDANLLNQKRQIAQHYLDQSHSQSQVLGGSSAPSLDLGSNKHQQLHNSHPPDLTRSIQSSDIIHSHSHLDTSSSSSSSSSPPSTSPTFNRSQDVKMFDSNGFPLHLDNTWSTSESKGEPDESETKRGTKRRKDEMSTAKSKGETSQAAVKQEKEREENADEAAASTSANAAGDGVNGRKKNMGLPPSKRACLFCRNRKSRCDGQQPCGTCIKRGKESDCTFTVSRRGGRPKDKSAGKKKFTSTDASKDRSAQGQSKQSNSNSKGTFSQETVGNQQQDQHHDEEGEDWNPDLQNHLSQPDLQNHLSQLFQLSELPSNVRIPGAVPQLAPFQSEQQPEMDDLFNFNWPMTNLGDQMQGVQGEGEMGVGAQLHNPNEQGMEGIINLSPAGNSSLDPSSIPQLFPPEQGVASNTSFNQQAGPSASPSDWINQFNQTSNSPALFDSQIPQSQPQIPAKTSFPPISQTETPVLPSQPAAAANSASSSASNPQSFLATSRDARIALLAEYYKSLYRFIPVTLPASVPDHLQILERHLPPTEESPFLLSLQALLPLLREGRSPVHKSQDTNLLQDDHSKMRKRMLRAQAAWYERKATDALESILERADNQGGDVEMNSTDTGERPKEGEGATIEVIQALCVLTIYHYGSGRALKARLKADQALGLAMANGLHRLSRPQPFSPDTQHARRATPSSPKSSFISLGSTNRPRSASNASSFPLREENHGSNRLSNLNELEAETFEMKKRCWWTVWTLVLWSAYNSGRIPTIKVDDPRVSCDLPVQGDGDVETWLAHTTSLRTLLLVQERVLALSHLQPEGGPTLEPEVNVQAQGERPISSLPPNAGRQEILSSMQQIDLSLQQQIAQIEARGQDHSRAHVNSQSDRSDSQLDEELVSYLRTSAAIQLYTSSLTLHIGQAFKGATLFERKLCFLNSVSANGSSEGNGCSDPLPMPEADSFLNDGDYLAPEACGSGSNDDAAWLEASKNSQQDLFARGPFLPRLSLQRCVHASKQLLAIARQRRGTGSHQPGLAPLGKSGEFSSSATSFDQPEGAGGGGAEPNPFNACSYVLISFTLLMQALAIAGRGASEDEEEDDDFSDDAGDDEEAAAAEEPEEVDIDEDKDRTSSRGTEENSLSHDSPLPRDLLDSARQAAVLSNITDPSEAGNRVAVSNAGSSGGGSSRASQQRMARLEQLWNSVAEARGVLEQTAMTWDMALPMFEEVNLCLRTSQLLLNQ